jgi:hypothetical protein
MRSTTTVLALLLALLVASPQCHGLALVALTVRTALLTKFTARQRSPSSPILYALSPSGKPTTTMKEENDSAALNDAVADYRSQMLDLVYERSLERLMK